MQRRIKRALFDLEDIFRRPLNHLGDRMTMCVARNQCPQDHHVEGPLEHFFIRPTLGCQCIPPLEPLWERTVTWQTVDVTSLLHSKRSMSNLLVPATSV